MITDYATLQSEVANWLARADLSNAIPTFIQLAESRINRTLFVRERMAEDSGTSVSGEITLPADFDRVNALRVQCGQRQVTLDAVPLNVNRAEPGLPDGYSVTGDTITLNRQQDVDYTLSYWQRIPALSGGNPTNWLLAKEPGLYLYGALIEAAPYLRNDERAMVWATQYQTTLDDCLRSDEYARFGTGTVMRVSDAP